MKISSCEHITEIFVWLTPTFFFVFGLFLEKIQSKYINRRYEEETDLFETKYFQHSVILNLLFSGSGSITGIYTMHLFTALVCNDYLFSKFTRYSDIKDRNDILKQFSKKEKVYTLITIISFVLFLIFLFGFILMSKFICPNCIDAGV